MMSQDLLPNVPAARPRWVSEYDDVRENDSLARGGRVLSYSGARVDQSPPDSSHDGIRIFQIRLPARKRIPSRTTGPPEEGT